MASTREAEYINMDQCMESKRPKPLMNEYDELSSEEDEESTDLTAHRNSGSFDNPPPIPSHAYYDKPRKPLPNPPARSVDPIRMTQPSPGQYNRRSGSSASMLSSHSTSTSYYNVYGRPDMIILPWYHPGLVRNAAEALLITSGRDGSYLMRDSRDGTNWSVSVRSHHAVRHFQLFWDGKKFKFGLAHFTTVEEMIRHFDNQPLMSGESGVAVTLLYPYPREVSEPVIYETTTVHAEMGRLAGDQAFSPVLAIGSKEGYLYKIGAIRRSWQRRWFVLFKNELRYYKRKDDARPIRIINLEDASEIDNIDIPGKPFCVKVVTPKRSFVFQGSSEGEKNEWLIIIKWKLEQIRKSHAESQGV